MSEEINDDRRQLLTTVAIGIAVAGAASRFSSKLAAETASSPMSPIA